MTKRVRLAFLALIIILAGGSLTYYWLRPLEPQGVNRHNQVQGDNGTCNGQPRGRETITIIGNDVQPRFVKARLCRQLVIQNNDGRQHKITFSQNGESIAYDDVRETTIAPGQSQTITLIDKGVFSFADTEDPSLGAEFMVE